MVNYYLDLDKLFEWCKGGFDVNDDARKKYFERIVDRLSTGIRGKSVLWVGCGAEIVAPQLVKLGHESYGLVPREYGHFAASTQRIWVDDLEKPLSRTFDLIVSFEIMQFAENKENAGNILSNLCNHTDSIIFSSTPYDWQEANGVVNFPISYWVGLFADLGFYRDFAYDVSFISPWAVSMRRVTVDMDQIINLYEEKIWSLEQENLKRRMLNIEQQETIIQKTKQIFLLSKSHGSLNKYRKLSTQEMPRNKIFEVVDLLAPLNTKRRAILKKVWNAFKNVRSEK